MGRRLLLTPQAEERYLEAIRAAAVREVAARRAGWSPRTLYRYLAATTPAALAFQAAAEQAENDLELRLGAVVAKAALTNPRWAMELLTRRFPQHWARRPADGGDAREQVGPAPDEVVELDVALVETLVPRLLAAGLRMRQDTPAALDWVAKFETRAPRRVGPDQEDDEP